MGSSNGDTDRKFLTKISGEQIHRGSAPHSTDLFAYYGQEEPLCPYLLTRQLSYLHYVPLSRMNRTINSMEYSSVNARIYLVKMQRERERERNTVPTCLLTKSLQLCCRSSTLPYDPSNVPAKHEEPDGLSHLQAVDVNIGLILGTSICSCQLLQVNTSANPWYVHEKQQREMMEC